MFRFTLLLAAMAVALPHDSDARGRKSQAGGSAYSASVSAPRAAGRGKAAGRARAGGGSPGVAGAVRFSNCSEARAAGAAPVRRGDPGYSRRLDRDGDGIGCE